MMTSNLNENNIWKKRFSVGIAIETTLSDFEGMLENYGRFRTATGKSLSFTEVSFTGLFPSGRWLISILSGNRRSVRVL